MKTLEQISVIPESGILIRREGAVLRVFFDISRAAKRQLSGESEEKYSQPEDLCDCYNVDVVAPINYGRIVSAIVNDRYSADDVQALSANYIAAKEVDSELEAEKRAEYIEEWAAFQNWRAMAKTVAEEIIENDGRGGFMNYGL